MKFINSIKLIFIVVITMKMATKVFLKSGVLLFSERTQVQLTGQLNPESLKLDDQAAMYIKRYNRVNYGDVSKLPSNIVINLLNM